jgi:type II secretion system protein G
MRASPRGFTLIELMIVVAILGILAAVAIPGLTSAFQRARQKRTMADMRTVATAVSAYGIDYSFMPRLADSTVEALTPYLVPTYLRDMPALDGWRRSMQYKAEGLSYTLTSFGADGLEQPSRPFGPTTNFSDDIVLSNGVFVQWPDGMQVN